MSKFDFNPVKHKKKLLPLLKELLSAAELTPKTYHKVIRRHPKAKSQLFSKSEIIAGLRRFNYPALVKKLQMKPIRTLSGVVPVTLLTKPYPCPGKCIYCPNDPSMPKSYLSAEPGAQRASLNQFDPYHQAYTRLQAYYANGHPTDKVELIILGGTWSAYPLKYQLWFIKRCFDALNDFQPGKTKNLPKIQTTSTATWTQLKKSQQTNETATTRCIGLSLETRPDFITQKQIINLRRLGCTKLQIGVQSLDNQILKLNLRGHTLKETKQAFKLLRSAGFKIQAHWMANLYGSTPSKDIQDFKKLFSHSAYRPDELKIYPTSLLATAPLMDYYHQGLWHPYSKDQLLKLLVTILPTIPLYCRLTRMIRDFSADDIVSGSKTSNLRQLVEKQVLVKNKTIQEIRFREIRRQSLNLKTLKLKTTSYSTSIGQEKFLQFITPDNHIVAFLRLSLPQKQPFIKELQNSALIREIHVYGQALKIGETAKTQHLGLGTQLINQAKTIAKKAGYKQLSVISAIGTKEYYRNRAFKDGQLYQHFKVD